MRFIISIIILFAIFVYFKYVHDPVAIEYPVMSKNDSALSQISEKQIRYRVPKAYRFLAADIYRTGGYFTGKITPPIKTIDTTGKKTGGVRSLTEVSKTRSEGLKTNIRLRMSDHEVKSLELYPKYGFWEQYGRWILLVFVILCLSLVFRGK